MDHHHIPQFYLKRWARPDGKLSVMRLVHGGKVVTADKYPAGTGYVRDLYKTDGVPDEKAHHLEVAFMSPLDNAANRALHRILAMDRSPWNEEDTKAWTVFLLSLMFRHPEAVEQLQGIMKDIWRVSLDDLERNYEKLRQPDFPETYAEFIKLTDPASPQIAATNFLMQTIENERLGPNIVGLHWSAIRTKDGVHSLLTSDRPIVRPLPLHHPEAYIALPVDPHTLFIASKQFGFEKELSKSPHSELVDHINYAVISQAREFVWAVDESQLGNVRKFIATAAPTPLLSDEQLANVLRSVTTGEPPV